MVGHLQEHTAAVNSIAVAHDNKFFATASDDGSIRVWDCHKLEGKAVTNKSRMCIKKPVRLHSRSVTDLVPQGRMRKATFCDRSHSVAAGSSDGSLYVFRIEHANKAFKPEQHLSLDLQEDGCIVDLHQPQFGHSALLYYVTVRGRIHAWLVQWVMSHCCLHSLFRDWRTNREAWCLDSLPAQGLTESILVDPSQSWLLAGTAR